MAISVVNTVAGVASADGGDATTVDTLDSTAFAILAGQAGGQTLNGGTAASNNLTLDSTANATKGSVVISGSVKLALATKAAADSPYTATKGNFIVLANAVAGAITVNLPAASGNSGLLYVVKKIDATGNAVTIDGSGAETIDGAATYVLAAQYESVTLACDGTNWHLI